MEQTSKRWKAPQIIGLVIAMVGIAIIVSTSLPLGERNIGTTVYIGLAVAVLGGIMAIIGAVGGWWHHG
jgi:hypothetical protein